MRVMWFTLLDCLVRMRMVDVMRFTLLDCLGRGLVMMVRVMWFTLLNFLRSGLVMMRVMREGGGECLVAGVCNECNDGGGRETHDGSFQIKVVGLKMKRL